MITLTSSGHNFPQLMIQATRSLHIRYSFTYVTARHTLQLLNRISSTCNQFYLVIYKDGRLRIIVPKSSLHTSNVLDKSKEKSFSFIQSNSLLPSKGQIFDIAKMRPYVDLLKVWHWILLYIIISKYTWKSISHKDVLFYKQLAPWFSLSAFHNTISFVKLHSSFKSSQSLSLQNLNVTWCKGYIF